MRQGAFGCAALVEALLLPIAAPQALAVETPIEWSSWSASPVPADMSTLIPFEKAILARCGWADAGLSEAAHAVLARRLSGLPMPEIDDIARMQRAAGEPHPWARAWFASGRNLDSAATMAKLDEWLGPVAVGPLRRCGVASREMTDGARTLAVVMVDVFADIKPLPTRVRPGQWLTVEARLRVQATGGTVVVLGPNGPPRSLLTSFDGKVLRARFAPEQRGEFAVQVMADMVGGPRPVIEAAVFAGVDPTAARDDPPPADDTGNRGLDDSDRLSQWIRAARRAVGLRPLVRDPRLDAVARAHATQMVRVDTLAHDAGDGEPFDRLREAGVDSKYAGENVSHASTVALANRAFWASPSHRANLLRREFDRVGVAVVRDQHGDAWAVETFIGGR